MKNAEKTWTELTEELRAAGLSPAALEAARHVTAGERHEARVTATIRAALDLLGVDAGDAENPATIARDRGLARQAATLIALDLSGVGGYRYALEGDGSPRATARLLKGNLGAGRWQAFDGGAYRGAAEEAWGRLSERYYSPGDIRFWDSVLTAEELADVAHIEQAGPWIAACAARRWRTAIADYARHRDERDLTRIHEFEPFVKTETVTNPA